jgi:hypothetical protein
VPRGGKLRREAARRRQPLARSQLPSGDHGPHPVIDLPVERRRAVPIHGKGRLQARTIGHHGLYRLIVFASIDQTIADITSV